METIAAWQVNLLLRCASSFPHMALYPEVVAALREAYNQKSPGDGPLAAANELNTLSPDYKSPSWCFDIMIKAHHFGWGTLGIAAGK